MKINSCQEKMNLLSEQILNRIYKIKSHIQTSHWNHLNIEEKLEQLIDINDTLFEQIVSETKRIRFEYLIHFIFQASALDIADGIKTSSVSTVVVNITKES